MPTKIWLILPPSHIGLHVGAQEVKEAGTAVLILFYLVLPETQPAACSAPPRHASQGIDTSLPGALRVAQPSTARKAAWSKGKDAGDGRSGRTEAQAHPLERRTCQSDARGAPWPSAKPEALLPPPHASRNTHINPRKPRRPRHRQMWMRSPRVRKPGHSKAVSRTARLWGAGPNREGSRRMSVHGP